MPHQFNLTFLSDEDIGELTLAVRARFESVVGAEKAKRFFSNSDQQSLRVFVEQVYLAITEVIAEKLPSRRFMLTPETHILAADSVRVLICGEPDHVHLIGEADDVGAFTELCVSRTVFNQMFQYFEGVDAAPPKNERH